MDDLTPTNGHDAETLAEMRALAETYRALETSIILARSQFFAQAGVTFGGARDFYAVLGYERQITARQFRERYYRGGVAGRVVDAFPNATWRGEVEVIEDEDPQTETAFEKAWVTLDKRLQAQAKFRRVDLLSGLSTFAVLLIGASGGGDLNTELPRSKTPDGSGIIYLTPFGGGGGPATTRSATTQSSVRAMAWDADCSIKEYEVDPKNPRYGLPKIYQIKRVDLNNPQVDVHWSRIIHVAEGTLDDDVFGLPALERVWNLLDDLDKVTGGGAEAFWLRANQGLHINIDKDMALSSTKDTLEALKADAEAYQHQLQRWIRTRGVDIEPLGSDVANFANPADAILTQISGAKGIPKRILTGSEMGELASSQDRDNWRDQIDARQKSFAGPVIVRQFVDRLISYGYLPTPKQGADAYQVVWPHQETLTEQDKAEGAAKWATVNQSNPTMVFTEDEIRDKWYGMEPLSDEQKQAAIKDKQAQNAPPPGSAPAVPPRPGLRAASDYDDEMVAVLVAAIEANNHEVIDEILGLRTAGGVGSGNYGHAGRPGEVGGSMATHIGGVPFVTPGGADPYDHYIAEVKAGRTTFEPFQAAIFHQQSSKYRGRTSAPTLDQVAELHKAYSALTKILRNPDIGLEVSNALGGASAEEIEQRLRDLQSGYIEDIYGGTGKKSEGVAPALAMKAAAEGDDPVTQIQTILDAIQDRTVRTMFVQLLKEMARAAGDLRSAGGPGSGNFGHAGRPGYVGGSAESGLSPETIAHIERTQKIFEVNKAILDQKLKEGRLDLAKYEHEVNVLRSLYPSREHMILTAPEYTKAKAIVEQVEHPASVDFEPSHEHQIGTAISKLIDKYGVDWFGELAKLHQKGKISDLIAGRLDASLGLKTNEEYEIERVLGGPGSGNFDHAGRPGEIGGSAPHGGFLDKYPAYEPEINAFREKHGQKKLDEDVAAHFSNLKGGAGVPSMAFQMEVMDAGRKRQLKERREAKKAGAAARRPSIEAQLKAKYGLVEGDRVFDRESGTPGVVKFGRDGQPYVQTEMGQHLVGARWQKFKTLGGPGSGNFGHAGRPGEVGGSAPEGSSPRLPFDSRGRFINRIKFPDYKAPETTLGPPVGELPAGAGIDNSLEHPVTLPEDLEEHELGGGVNESLNLTSDTQNLVFKPVDGESRGFRNEIQNEEDAPQAEREVIASRLDQAMGLNIVPKTTLAVWNGQEGMVQPFVENADQWDSASGRASSREEIAKAAILDAVIGNLDRHGGNALVTQDGHFIAIDHGLSLGYIHPGDRIRSFALYSLTEGDISVAAQKNIAARLKVASQNLGTILRGSHLDTEEREALRERINIVLTRLEKGEADKLTEDFSVTL